MIQKRLKQHGFTEEHYEALGRAVAVGYKTVQKLISETPMLSQFGPGIANAGNLRNIAVEFALQSLAADSKLFYTEMGWNAARNHLHLRVSFGGVVLTSHYCGKRGDSAIRKAVVRGELAMRNGDLFADEAGIPDIDHLSSSTYIQLAHSGDLKPRDAMLMIPNRDQVTFTLPPLILDIPEPDDQKVEQIENQVKNRFDLIVEKELRDGTDISTDPPEAS